MHVHLRRKRERERRRGEPTLRNFFTELISLMRPDHLTGMTIFFSFFPSFPGSLAQHTHTCIQPRVCIGTFRESSFSSRMHSVTRKDTEETDIESEGYISVAFTHAGPLEINRRRDAHAPLRYYSGRDNKLSRDCIRKVPYNGEIKN